MRRVRDVVLVGVTAAVLSLTGCSGSGDGGATGPVATAGGSATPRPTDAGREGDAPQVSAQEICAALKAVRPAVRDADNDRDARAAISVRLTQVYSAKQLSGQMKPATVDALTKDTCPKVRTQLLRSANLTSLADI